MRADFLAGASMDGGNPEILLQSISRYYKFLPGPQQEVFLSEVNRKASSTVPGGIRPLATPQRTSSDCE